MLNETQIRERSRYLGGSDAAAVLGLSRWKTALEVWGEKTGNVEKKDISNRLQVKLGHKLESTVTELFSEATGLDTHAVTETKFHPKFPFLGANLDRGIVGEDAFLECKTTSPWKAEEWVDGKIPAEYAIQVHHYLAVTGAKHAYIAVLIGNQDFKWQKIERDEALLDSIVLKEVSFWENFVVPKVMPAILAQANDNEVLSRMFPESAPGSGIVLSSELDALLEARHLLVKRVGELEEEVATIENRLRAEMAENELATSERFSVTWKSQVQKRVDTQLLKAELPDIHQRLLKEIKMRVLRVKRKEEE